MKPLRWAVVLVDFDPTVGHEEAGHRRAVVVSYEAFHSAGMAAVCPVSARAPKYPGEVSIPLGQAGQTKDAVILCHQLRTIDLARVTTYELAGSTQYVTHPAIRRAVRAALSHHLGLDLPAAADGAA
jgi:mRNA-degrading endonuclease toxin of MazEF toxin-antitoxin module